MPDLTFLWLCLTALVAGAVNSVAGGGTLLTFPALVGVLSRSYSPDVAAVLANATSTVALVPGSLAGAWGYRHQVRESRGWLLLLIGPSLAGGVVGSLLVTRLDPKYFAALVPWLILVAALLLLVDTLIPRKSAAREGGERPARCSVLALVLFQFAVSVYGGYFGAGIGILMLSSLALMRIGDINRMNAVKTVLTTAINGVSAAVFIYERKVRWEYSVAMAVCAIIGGYFGARGALRIPPRRVRWIVIGIGFTLATYYFARRSSL